VYNPLGQIISEVVNGEMEAGYHEVQFDAGNLASGVYLYRMQGGSLQSRSAFLPMIFFPTCGAYSPLPTLASMSEPLLIL
jgi:hypothetical protein